MFFVRVIIICVSFVKVVELNRYSNVWLNPQQAYAGGVQTTMPMISRPTISSSDCLTCNYLMCYLMCNTWLYEKHKVDTIWKPHLSPLSENSFRTNLFREHSPKNMIMTRSFPIFSQFINLNKLNVLKPVNEVIPLFNKLPRSLDLPFKTQSQPFSDIRRTSVESSVTNFPSFDFWKSLDFFERKFYAISFAKMASIYENSKENGMSFVLSALFLHIFLVNLSLHVDNNSREEIEKCLKLKASEEENIKTIRRLVSTFPQNNINLKFYWTYHLVLRPEIKIGDGFQTDTDLHMNIDRLNGTETPDEIVTILNNLVQKDSAGVLHNTFENDDFDDDVNSIFLTTVFFRARWRSAPTVLNGTLPFLDDATPQRTVRCIRINDIMRYADLHEWDAEAIEISYATEGLSLLIIVPRGPSIRSLASHVASTSIDLILMRMQTMRIAATLPMYTLRMTVLLPDKLKTLGLSRLTRVDNTTFTMSQAVQRIMFWAEPGRNAFKDDGIEWDESPKKEVVVNRPYIFFVRWRNVTLLNGNFVL